METCVLRDGSEEAQALVCVIYRTLEKLSAEAPVILYELVCKCRDRDHKLFGESGARLQALDLVQGGGVHASVRAIVLCAIDGEGFDLRLQSPIKPAVMATSQG